MVHIVEPPSHDDVVVPQTSFQFTTTAGADENADGDGIQKLRSEEQKMILRLMHSAALVSAEAKANERPLDADTIAAAQAKVARAMESKGVKESVTVVVEDDYFVCLFACLVVFRDRIPHHQHRAAEHCLFTTPL